ncbi:MAG: DUF2851 family protein, partial [Planctomycetes bacterium]|nr:DUF2851 family protein [Planctomycetota bacterium]
MAAGSAVRADRCAAPRSPAYGAGRPPLSEYLVHCVWLDQRLRAAGLTTLDGRAVRVITPGHWNLDGGPDFRGAELEIGGVRTAGEVEVHLATGDWRRHGHDRQAAYAGVALHVALTADGPEAWAIAADGRRIPTLVLDAAVEPPIEELARRLGQEGWPRERFAGVGRCHRAAVGRRALRAFLGRFLDRAGDARFGRAAARWGAEAEGDVEESFHRGLFEALGYRGNAAPFLALARALPRRRLAQLALGVAPEERAELIEAVLLDRAGLLSEWAGTGAVGAARAGAWSAHVACARRRLAGIGEMPEPVLRPEAWRMGSSRPANAPARRLAGAARLLAATPAGPGLFAELAAELAAGAGEPPAPRRLARLEARLIVGAGAGIWGGGG